MNSSFSRPRLRWLLTVLAAAAFAAPAAQAHHAPGEGPGATTPRQPFETATSQSSTPTQWNASSREIDRLGPKNVPLHHSVLPAPVNVVKIVRPGGFARGDAAVGAAVLGLLLALVSGLAMLAIRRRRLRRSLAIASLAS
jgi:hypothetical protein